MCIGPDSSANDPAVILARSIKEGLGVEIHPEALRTFIRCRWDTIAAAAHKIHDPTFGGTTDAR